MGDGVVAIPVSGNMKVGRRRPGAEESAPVSSPFLAGPENELVEAAVSAVLDGPSSRYNPLLFHGPTGTGKSHLTRGVAAAWRSRRQRVEYITAKDFARGLVEAHEAQAVDDWRERFRTADLLAIEALELLARHPAAQQEMIATLDVLLRDGGQVVATANVPPEQLRDLLPGLRSRLSSGLSVPLCPPGPATRMALLERIAARGEVPLDPSAAQLLADGLTGTVPEVIGALRQLELQAYVDGERIRLPAAKRFLAELGGAAPSLGEIAMATARHFSVARSDMRSPSRVRAVVTARDVAMYLSRQLTGKSLQQIGRYYGGRDHTTVLHGCRKIEQLVQQDPTIRDTVESLQKKWQHGGLAKP